MASKQKMLGQVFTPKKIVRYMCDMCKYHGDLSKSVFEPSFGDGAFLCEIYRRMIQWGRSQELSDDEIAVLIDEHLYGNELDPYWYDKARKNLDKVAEQEDFDGVCEFPNVTNGDTLEFTKYYGTMDYVIGNPPYVKNSRLSNETKELISDFMFTGGSTDLYIIFYEFCMNCLKEDVESHLIFITPRTYMNAESCKTFRRYLISNNYIEDLVDYGSDKVFANADVYVSILHLNTHKVNTQMGYYVSRGDLTPELPLEVVDLSVYNDTTAAEPWDFCIDANENEISLGDLCTITSGSEVVRKNVFIQEGYFGDPEYILFNGFMVENEILKPVLKGSAFTSDNDYDTILFPYIREDNLYRLMSLEEVQRKYPKAYRFLQYHKNIIERDGEDNWGSVEQDLSAFYAEPGCKRYTFKHVMSEDTKKLELIELPEGVGVYSGFIISIPETRLDFVRGIFESEEFATYIKGVSRVMSGGYIVARLMGIKSYKACSYEQWKELNR